MYCAAFIRVPDTDADESDISRADAPLGVGPQPEQDVY